MTEPSKKGKEIEEYLNSVNMDPWFYIYENYVKNDSKEELNQVKQDSKEESDQIKQDSSDQIS